MATLTRPGLWGRAGYFDIKVCIVKNTQCNVECSYIGVFFGLWETLFSRKDGCSLNCMWALGQSTSPSGSSVRILVSGDCKHSALLLHTCAKRAWALGTNIGGVIHWFSGVQKYIPRPFTNGVSGDITRHIRTTRYI